MIYFDFKFVPRDWGCFVYSQSDSERRPKEHTRKTKSSKDILFYVLSQVFASEEYELMQVKVKTSPELKRYVSQNISSYSWNSTVNKVGGLVKFLFSEGLKVWQGLFSLGSIKTFCRRRKERLKMIWYVREALWTPFNIELDWKSLFHSLGCSCALNLYIVVSF